MTEYIKREYAVDAVADVYYNTPDINLSCEKFEAAILKIQSADVAPVRHGHWNTGYFHDRVCSCCLHPDNDINDYAHSYCPNCGAKMDESEDKNEIS